MVSFYPGPSRVHDEVPAWVREAHKVGILSMNHRSKEFISLYERTVKLFRKKLLLPADYSVYFISSATECWEIIAQSLIQHSSMHLYNGAFGQKWFDYTQRLKSDANNLTFSPDDIIPVRKYASAEVICITQNETSNGTQVSNEHIRAVKAMNSGSLIAVDATSSMAGIYLDFTSADVWFASVQKCFGLPAGLAVMCCSPRAVERMKQVNEGSHYNSLTFIHQMSGIGQTPFTPNVLGIYLLMCSLDKMSAIRTIDKQTTRRYQQWEIFLSRTLSFQHFGENADVRSRTVLTLKGDPSLIKVLKLTAKKKGFLLGEGYGALKANTFRVANFPALKEREIGRLMQVIKESEGLFRRKASRGSGGLQSLLSPGRQS